MSPIDIEWLAKLRAAAAPGEWHNDGDYRVRTGPNGTGECIAELKYCDGDNGNGAALIVAAVNALPDMLRIVRAVKAWGEARRDAGARMSYAPESYAHTDLREIADQLAAETTKTGP